ncbi:MAG: DEAD/DEAH box helicase family protein [Anaerolineales bacterium]
MFEHLTFRYPFRGYQRTILTETESALADGSYHIVAPPGSGRTIVGLELIRRFNRPAVIFVPTLPLQTKWRERAQLFLPEGNENLDALVSLNPHNLAPINILTYQTISSPGEARTHVEAIARARWIEELLQEERVPNEAAAQARLRVMEENNPRSYQQELARRYRGLKEQLLKEPHLDLSPLLHPDAQGFLADLLDYGVSTVVLDECRHLLDYWALVLHCLVDRIPEPKIIGLAATLPSPETDREFENYHSLIGSVDFTVPTPAVVKEGNLAPYRDLVYFVKPSQREMDYLLHVQDAFEEAIGELTASAPFRDWVVESVVRKPYHEEVPYSWEEFLRSYPFFSIAGLRFLHQIGYELPAEMLIPNEAREEMVLEDWIALLERYGLDVLRVRFDAGARRSWERLRRILRPFGFNLTDDGVHHVYSPGAMLLGLSESKNEAVAEILRAEDRALGERMRAAVVTDFEKSGSGVQRLPGILDPAAGSALQIFRHLMAQPDLQNLTPVLVTGRTLLVNSAAGDRLVERLNPLLEEAGMGARCYTRPTDIPHVLQIDGEGEGWNGQTYTWLVSAAFNPGLTRCLVGTRGVLSEGGDLHKLNTLIDLTSATTRPSVQELRGRTLQLDPDWPRKLAHHWDVVCVTRQFDKGDRDLARCVRRHEHHWGIKTTSLRQQAQQMPGTSPRPEERGQIVKGISHLDARLAYELGFSSFTRIDFETYTAQMLKRVPARDVVYDLWGVGDDYSNLSCHVVRLDTRDLRIRTAHTIEQTLQKVIRIYRPFAGVALFLLAWLVFRLIWGLYEVEWGNALLGAYRGVGLFLLLGALLGLALNTRKAYRYVREQLLEQPPAMILLDIGRALLVALREGELISSEHEPQDVKIIAQPDQSYDVLLARALPAEAELFVAAYQQIFETVRNQRYLVLRDESDLPTASLHPLWFRLRRWLRNRDLYGPAYHPVPDVLSTNADLAEIFARAWQRYVGGGELVYTYSEQGQAVLLRARAQDRPEVKGLTFEVWR